MKDDIKRMRLPKQSSVCLMRLAFSKCVHEQDCPKKAGVSSSTLYVYYENKDDMFSKVYADVKIRMHKECAKGIEMNETVEKLCEENL